MKVFLKTCLTHFAFGNFVEKKKNTRKLVNFFSGRHLAKKSQTAQTLVTSQALNTCFVYDANAKLQPLKFRHVQVTFTLFFKNGTLGINPSDFSS